MAANPERGVGNDPEPLGVAFLQGSSFTLMISLTCPQGITVAANPERGIGNDPEPLGVAFLQGPSCTSMINSNKAVTFKKLSGNWNRD